MRKVLVGAIVMAALSGVAVAAYFGGYIRLVNPPETTYPVRGIDVSRHQGSIDWARVDAAGIDFTYIKASEGQDLRDPRFAENWSGAERLGARGAYHFFTFCSPGARQARNFLDVAPTIDGELQPAVDVEFEGNCAGWKSIDRIRTDLASFVRVVHEELGRPPILYVTKESYGRIVRGYFDAYPLWIREVARYPWADAYPALLFWQYAGNGRVPGIKGRVDLNVFVGSEDNFMSRLPGGVPLAGRYRTRLKEAAEDIVGFLRGRVSFERIRLAREVDLHLGREGGGTKVRLRREELR